MKRGLLFLVLVALLIIACKQSKTEAENIYIYDSEKILKIGKNKNDSLDYISFNMRKSIHIFIDTFLTDIISKAYCLDHYYRF